MANKKALIVGGRGMTGGNIIRALEKAGGWDIIGLGRGKPAFDTKAEFIAVDLLDPKDSEAKLNRLSGVTHMFYSGLTGSIAAENTVDNLALLVNSVGVVEKNSPGLERVVLMQGGKYYGVHLGPHKSPSKETDPRHMPPNFYYDQQDYLEELSQGKNWNLTCLRPEAVIGFAEGIPLNTASLVAIYAEICNEMNVPFHFPGPEAGFKAFNKFVDARLLGRAAVWAAVTPEAGGEAFNVTNNSGMRWCNLWPLFTNYFGCQPGVVMPFSLKDFMADKEPVWQAVVQKYQLKARTLSDIGDWFFADWFFGRTWDTILEDTKRIQSGFTEVIDTDENFTEIFDEMRTARHIPPAH